MTLDYPDLPGDKYSGSWIIVHKGTLKSRIELFDPENVRLINKDKNDILTAYQYLNRKNEEIKNGIF